MSLTTCSRVRGNVRPRVAGHHDDVDAMYAHTQAVGAPSEPPEDKPYGVRMLTVKDPEGVSWGFIKRI